MRVTDEETAKAFVAKRCSETSMEKLDLFVSVLREGNTSQNLVSPNSLKAIWARHVADCAQLLDYVPRETGIWLDLGTGAGFPGLVIATMRPNQDLILVESRRLRVEWLQHLISVLALPNCRVEGRDVKRMTTLSASVISARAFAPLPRLFALSARFSTKQTRWVLPKGRSAAQEVAALPAGLRRMFHVEPSVTDPDAGIIVGNGLIEVAS
jgi:16S rRNA (guanine527-N7)-methyltransferase